MVNYFMTGGGDIRKNVEQGTRFTFGEVGLGAYSSLERGSASIFAGMGEGQLYNHYGAGNFSNFHIRRWFVQPALAYRDRFFQGGLALRLSRLIYTNGETSFDIDEDDLAAIRKIEEQTPLFLPELGLSASVGFSPFVLSVSLTSVFPDVEGFNFSRFNTNLMLSLDFGQLARRQKKGNMLSE
jgi:hypothetical protein